MKTLRVISVICFIIFAVLTAIGVYIIINDAISLYSIADSIPDGFLRDVLLHLFGLF